MREGILGHLAGFWIEASKDIHEVGRIPNVVVGIDSQTVRSRLWAGEVVFLEGLGLGVKPADDGQGELL